MKEYEAVFQNQPVDVGEEFAKQQNHFLIGSKVPEFDPDTASGKIPWKGLALKQRVSYHPLTLQFEDRAPPDRRQVGAIPRRTLAHAHRRPADRRLILGGERRRVFKYL